MKKLAAFGFLILAGCAPQAKDGPTGITTKAVEQVSAPSPSVDNSIFDNTPAKDEKPLISAASDRLVKGYGYPSAAQALGCLNNEMGRPRVYNVCLLLAAKANHRNAEIDEKIQNDADRSSEGAIAIAWQPKLIKDFPTDRMKKVMEILKPYPAGLRTGLAANWGDQNSVAQEKSYFKGILAPGPKFTELASYFKFWITVDPVYAQEQTLSYCNARALGISNWRCLRLKAAIGKAENSVLILASIPTGILEDEKEQKRASNTEIDFRNMYPNISKASYGAEK